ncbi:hypothetical protein KM427_15850 [Nocardioides sp. LMS-CY]|uniref:hypothetical protein n=1 Tax=Nocardioides sp. (strain LMS-CY) TaxID=2840457 RepID=UPI001C003A67|nr:hypothetical protein [Nocardioides sp. LMS-CY]QWF20455.1 hypothetical protein KM427_15850 [Nocardioides sp. LMS-CY]
MTEVLLACTNCDEEIAVDMDAAILRMDAEPRADAELLFCCPACGRPGLRRVVGELLTLLLLVGVQPLRLSEPTLADADRAPTGPPLTYDDLLTWHEQLTSVRTVRPWERPRSA